MTQKNALDILKLGKNVFLTGAAGSGKTYVLNKYIAYLKKNAIPVAVTASTGIAATHMNGKTIHSWAHIGIKDSLSSSDLNAIFARKEFRQSIAEAKVLIIDEVSMLNHLDSIWSTQCCVRCTAITNPLEVSKSCCVVTYSSFLPCHVGCVPNI